MPDGAQDTIYNWYMKLAERKGAAALGRMAYDPDPLGAWEILLGLKPGFITRGIRERGETIRGIGTKSSRRIGE